jgi:hypothetical protein
MTVNIGAGALNPADPFGASVSSGVASAPRRPAAPTSATAATELSAWSWCGADPATEQDLVFVVATYSRGEVGWVSRRAGLPRPTFRARLRPFEPGFAAAIARPFSLLWMPLDQFARRSDHWLDEEQLTARRGLR